MVVQNLCVGYAPPSNTITTDKTFKLIVHEGQLEKATKTLREISEKLLEVQASRADSSNDSNKRKIHYQFLDPVNKRSMTTFEVYQLQASEFDVEEEFFNEFDVHICGLI